MKPRKIAIANMKGGVGKTATAVHLAMQLAHQGARVALVDLDAQANATDHFNEELNPDLVNNRNSYHFLTERLEAEDCLHPLRRFPTLFVMPATLDVTMAGFEMMGRDQNAVLKIQAQLDELPVDFIVIDTPPSQIYSIKAGIYAADLVVTPTDLKTDSLKGLNLIRQLIENVLFPPQVNLKKPVHLALPCNVTEKESERLRLLLREQGHTVCAISITRSRPLDTSMVKKIPLNRPGKNSSESETVAEFERLSTEVA